MSAKISKIGIGVVLLCVFSSVVYASTITQVVTDAVEPGSIIEIKVVVSNAVKDDIFTLEETFATPLAITNWTIDGAKEELTQIKTRKSGNSFAWSFTPTKRNPSIIELVDVPDYTPVGNYTLSATWFDRNGFSQSNVTFEVLYGPTNLSISNVTVTKKMTKSVVKSGTKNKQTILQEGTGGFSLPIWTKDIRMPTFSMPNLSGIKFLEPFTNFSLADAYSLWGIGFFAGSIAIVLLFAYFYQKTQI